MYTNLAWILVRRRPGWRGLMLVLSSASEVRWDIVCLFEDRITEEGGDDGSLFIASVSERKGV